MPINCDEIMQLKAGFGGDPRRAFRVEETPAEFARAMIEGLDKIIGDDDDGE